MSLYRLDLSYPDGRVVPVRDPVIGGDYIAYRRDVARGMARIAAAACQTTVVCTRIYGAGSMRESFRINP